MRRILRTPLGISLLIALIGALIGIGEPISQIYWAQVFKVAPSHGAPNIVLVDVGQPDSITTGQQAQLLDRLARGNPRKVFLDTEIAAGANPEGDRQLAQAVAAMRGKVAFVARSGSFDQFKESRFKLPPASIVGNGTVVASAWWSNYAACAIVAPYFLQWSGKEVPTLASQLAGVSSGIEARYYPDYTLDPAQVQVVEVTELAEGRVDPAIFAGKAVVVTPLKRLPMSLYYGHGYQPEIFIDLAGAAGLEKPVSFAFWNDLSFATIPLVLLCGLLLWFANRGSRRRASVIVLGTIALSFVAPITLRYVGIVAPPDCAWLMMLVYGGLRLWELRSRRIKLTSASGLPNLLAFSDKPIDVGHDVIVAAIARYEEILATLPQELHGEFAVQIARRISVGTGSDEIYHSDGGHFAWTDEARPLDVQFSHLEGLRALFSAPLQIGTHTFDTNIHFGIDRNEGLDPLTRVNSALASANEALSNGRAIELFEAQRLTDAPWELSLHARIDEGLRNGEIWLAFQSQWDIANRTICGAEALIRWDHPLRGPIAPDAFILQAERAGRIDALTYWVLEQAITAALALNARGPRFQMSVNLSAQMVDKAELVTNFAEIVKRRGIDPGLLTIEITETSSVRNRPAACHNLTQLRQMGFRLSIDDFGTGEASLAYLADLPSDELKIDRRFVSRLLDSDRDRTIVGSTIGLAHALGQSVVAEGIEDEATFQVLRQLGCDHAQGYLLGKPQPFATFEKMYDEALQRQTGFG